MLAGAGLVASRRLAAALAVLIGLEACGDGHDAGPDDPLLRGPHHPTGRRRHRKQGGVYYALGGVFAQAVTAATAGRLTATAAETGASVQNIQQAVAGTYQVAFSQADTVADAVQGTGSFSGAPQPIRALARLYPELHPGRGAHGPLWCRTCWWYRRAWTRQRRAC